MKQLTIAEGLKAFQDLFQSAKHEMFKAEVLQDYTAVDDSPSLRAWIDNNKRKSHALGKVDANIIAYRDQCLKSPANITRVHVVQEPYTPYLEWEIAVCYKDSLLSHNAELILLASLEEIGKVKLPDGDFWIFDNNQVLQWEYENGAGKLIGARLWDTDRGDSINTFLQLKEALLYVAKPIA